MDYIYSFIDLYIRGLLLQVRITIYVDFKENNIKKDKSLAEFIIA